MINPKKLICFSLWGTNPKYTIGAIKNAELAIEVYPDWLCRFYIANDVPKSIVTKLRKYNNVELIEKHSEQNDSMFWRFYAMSDDIEVMISRDTDSRLNYREKAAVDAWIKSGKSFHIMRDHRWHSAIIMGGMHGCRGDVIINIRQRIIDYMSKQKKTNYYQFDQNFLHHVIFPIVNNSVLIHDMRSPSYPWPTKRQNNEYVGAPFDENDKLLIEFMP